MKYLFTILFLLLAMTDCKRPSGNDISICIDAADKQHSLKGGMGASWHALNDIHPLNNEAYELPVREVASLGSAWGGNPPTSDSEAWQEIVDHASWLGMNFVRVELSMGMYLPEKNNYDWDGEEMKALYNILDWAQKNGADVFLQQMCLDVEWLALPGIHPLISAPNNLDDFSSGIATLLEYLVQKKGYSCIKYFCMTNEPPGGTWGYWWEPGDTENTTEAAWANLKETFDRRGIQIPIAGPDWTDMPPFEEEKLTSAEHFGAIDIHSYQGVTAEGEENLRKWASWAHAQEKPFFLTEYGNMSLGWGEDDPNQKSFDAALSNACDVMRGLRAGVDGFNRWSYTNRGNEDGQWQLIHTFDRDSLSYLSEVEAEPEAYYGFGIISRFLSKYSTTLGFTTGVPDSVFMSAALLSPDGELTAYMVNVGQEPLSLDLEIASFENREMYVYQVSKKIVSGADFRLNAMESFRSDRKKKIILPPRSITTVSSVSLDHNDRGVI